MNEKELKPRKLFVRRLIICICIIAAAMIAIALYADYLTRPKVITTAGYTGALPLQASIRYGR